jgi:hypothetical protein
MPVFLIILGLVAMVMFPPLAIIAAVALGIILLSND